MPKLPKPPIPGPLKRPSKPGENGSNGYRRNGDENGNGNAAVEAGIGGSIPFIAEFARAYPGATVLVTGVGDPQSRWHGIDESLDLAMWERACLAEALLLAGLQ